MRQERTVQASLFDLFAGHEIGRELKAMSQWLDEHRELIGLAAEDLRRRGVKETGREGLDPRLGDRSRQSGGQRPVLAHAQAPHRLSWRGAPTDRRRWRLRKPRQSRPGEAPRRPRRGFSQESWPAHPGYGQEHWIYRKLRNFGAGIESDIACLKRAYGLARRVWRGLDHFTAYVWSSVVAYNLALFARLKPA
jgi:hypothetical protein